MDQKADIHDLHSAIVAGLGAVSQMACAHAHRARTFRAVIAAEEKMRKEHGNGLPNVSRKIHDEARELLWDALSDIDALMQKLGDADDEPDDFDVSATTPAFDRISELLNSRLVADVPTHDHGGEAGTA